MALVTFTDLPSTTTPINSSNLNNNFTECNNIVASGSNANGRYIKYSDGTMIEWNNMIVDDQPIDSQYGGTILYTGTRTITFPIAFVGSYPSCQCSHFRWGTSGSWGAVNSVSLDDCVIRGYDFFSRATGTNCYISWMAIGRWKA